MKIGMNSQTLRIIWDDGSIMDFHITDGTTASKFMKIVNGNVPVQNDFEGYEVMNVESVDIPMAWGSTVDKMTNIEYTETGRCGLMLVNSDTNTSYGSSYVTQRRSPVGTTFYQPITTPVRQTPPPPRYDYSNTNDNEKNFKKLFGK